VTAAAAIMLHLHSSIQREIVKKKKKKKKKKTGFEKLNLKVIIYVVLKILVWTTCFKYILFVL